MIWVALGVCGSLLVYALVSAYLGRPLRLPVPRAVYDDMVRIADSEREHNRKLTKTILRLKVSQQAFLPTKADARKAREVDVIEAAINRSKHAKNPVHRSALSTWAEQEKSRGTPIAEIEDRLNHWDDINALRDDDRDNDEDDTLLS